jgi:hypothetical protein
MRDGEADYDAVVPFVEGVPRVIFRVLPSDWAQLLLLPPHRLDDRMVVAEDPQDEGVDEPMEVGDAAEQAASDAADDDDSSSVFDSDELSDPESELPAPKRRRLGGSSS